MATKCIIEKMTAEQILKEIYEAHEDYYRPNGPGVRDLFELIEELKVLYGDLGVSGQRISPHVKRSETGSRPTSSDRGKTLG